MIVLDLMTRECASVTTDDTLSVAAGRMWEKDCGAVPVLEGDVVVGMLTDRDICMATWSRGSPPDGIRVLEAMSTKLVTCTTADSIKQVEQAMRSQQVRRLPVVDSERHLLGIISLADIVQRESGNGVATTLAGICQRSPSPAALAAQACAGSLAAALVRERLRTSAYLELLRCRVGSSAIIRAMSAIARSVAFLSLLSGAALACSSDNDPPSAPNGGSSAGGSASTAGSSSLGGSVAGTSSGGNASNTAGAGAGGAAAGAAGTNAGGGGASAGAGGANAAGTDSGGAGGSSGGGGFWGPNGPKKQYTCPAGPFPEQELGQAVTVCEGFDFAYNYLEGPTWIASEGAFFFSNFPIGQYTGGDIIKFTPGAGCEVWLEEVGCNGLGFSPSGNLLAACQGPRAVMEYDVKTKQGRTIATMADGKLLDSPNDLIARSDGNVYFSNRTAELGNRPKGLGEGLVRIDPMGVLSVIQMGGLNGVALSPDETKLHVVTMGTWALDAAGVPGQKGGPTPSGDGIAVDCAGNITRNGTNSAFGGPDLKTLFIVGPDTQTHTRTATVPGIP